MGTIKQTEFNFIIKKYTWHVYNAPGDCCKVSNFTINGPLNIMADLSQNKTLRVFIDQKVNEGYL